MVDSSSSSASLSLSRSLSLSFSSFLAHSSSSDTYNTVISIIDGEALPLNHFILYCPSSRYQPQLSGFNSGIEVLVDESHFPTTKFVRLTFCIKTP